MWYARHKLLAMAAILAVVAVGLGLLIALPIYQRTSKLLTKIEAKTKERDELTTRVSLLSKLDNNVLLERVRILDSALPPKKDVLLYLASINGLSSELGLSFGGINLTPGELNEASSSAKKKVEVGVSSLESQIKIQGSKESVYAFLRTIEQVLPLMQIKDIKVGVVGENQYSLSLTLGMLWAANSTVDVKGPVTIFGEEEEKYFQQLAGYREYPGLMTQGITENLVTKTDVFSPAKPILQP